MKQVMMVFCIAILGCLVFTVYAAMLFFRYKSREIGVFLALGAGKRSLAGQIFRELFASMAVPALTGIALGPLFTLGIWQIFRLFLPDKESTVLSFTPFSLIICAAFLAARRASSWQPLWGLAAGGLLFILLAVLSFLWFGEPAQPTRLLINALLAIVCAAVGGALGARRRRRKRRKK